VPSVIDNLPALESLTIEGNPLTPTALDLQDEPLSTNQGIFLPFVTR